MEGLFIPMALPIPQETKITSVEHLDLIEKIWQHVGPKTYECRDDFIDGLGGWTITAREIDGQLAGATLENGAEFHFVTFGIRKSFPATLIAECLQPILDKHGFVVTRTPKEDIRQRRFNILIGFREVSADEFYINFHMNQLNLHRGKECLS